MIDGELCNYCWYSMAPTIIEKDLTVCVEPDYIYMYKGYTKNKFRGRRYYAISMISALNGINEMGYKGLVSLVETHNYPALKSCFRMGYSELGKICVINIFGKNHVFRSSGCKLNGIIVS